MNKHLHLQSYLENINDHIICGIYYMSRHSLNQGTNTCTKYT